MGNSDGRQGGIRGAWTPIAAALALAGLVAVVGSLGRGEDVGPLTAVGVTLSSVVLSGSAALAILLAGAGYGRLARPVFRESDEAAAIQLGVGLGIMLSAIHGVGALGLLAPIPALVLVAGGLGLLAHQLWPTARRLAKEDMAFPSLGGWWAALPAVAVMLVAASSMPGWLWDSEFGGYDVLEYHLELPQEWLASGRVEPFAHNVYSYLPSYVESAYAFLGAMTFAPDGVGASGGLLAGSGWRAIGAQMLHVGLALCTASLVAAFVRRSLVAGGVERARTRLPASLAGALTLSTPWVVVVGSMAYNEMGVTALGAGVMLVAIEDRIRPLWRGTLAGALVGVACGAKPTALILLTPIVGALLLGMAPTRVWWRLVGAGCVAGVLALAPWLVRNWLHGGNPVFPQLAGIFGSADWTGEQIDRYMGAHHFSGGVLERARLLVWTDPGAAADAADVRRWRGAMNPQWLALFPAALLAAGVALANRRTHRPAALLTLGLLGVVVAWMFGTHLQSRFLLPAVLPGAALVGLAIGGVRTRRAGRPMLVAGLVVIGAQSVALLVIYASQQKGRPNVRLPRDATLLRGDTYDAALGDEYEIAYINQELPPDARVSLLGASTPLYLARPVVYNTTWDSWPLGEAVEQAPDDPEAWSAALRARGVTHVLVDFGELGRLSQSGWIDPRVTPEAIEAWLGSLGRAMKVWGGGGGRPRAALYRIGTP
ncbi:MAG: hypothetical protein R3B57_00400 [Phycisphaerales bacterium]